MIFLLVLLYMGVGIGVEWLLHFVGRCGSVPDTGVFVLIRLALWPLVPVLIILEFMGDCLSALLP